MTLPILGHELFFPMDVDKKQIHLAVLDRDRLIKKVTLPYDAANLLSFVRKHYPNQKGIFAYEAGPTGYGLCDYLRQNGEDCRVAVPSMIPKAPGQRVKTNRLDAYNLGVQLRSGGLKLVHVPEEHYRDLRQLTRLRLKYSKRIAGIKNALRGLYLLEGILFPQGPWNRHIISQLQLVNIRPEIDFKVRNLVKELLFFHQQQIDASAEVRRFCRSDQEIAACIGYMMSLPGVGWIVSSYILAALGGYKHLKSVTKTAGFLGLGPSEHSTGERTRRGQITAIGDPNARKMIIQASWIGIRKDPQLRRIFFNVYGRNSERTRKQKAIVAVGRKNICRIHAVLRDQRNFEYRTQ